MNMRQSDYLTFTFFLLVDVIDIIYSKLTGTFQDGGELFLKLRQVREFSNIWFLFEP